MFDEETRTLIWNFSPYTPVRLDVMREVVFIKKWQQLMIPKKLGGIANIIGDGRIKVDEWYVDNEPRRFPVLHVFGGYHPSEHDTRIASNMIRWLGTNNGQSFLSQAQNYARRGIEQKLAHLTAWNEENIRDRMINYGRIPRDWLTESFDKATEKESPWDRQTVRDIETLDHVAHWLGGEKGQAFLKSCQHNIDIKVARHMAERRARLGLPPPSQPAP